MSKQKTDREQAVPAKKKIPSTFEESTISLIAPDPEANRIAARVRETANTAPLIRYLRYHAQNPVTFLGSGAVTLIADVLDGTSPATSKREAHAVSKGELKQLLRVIGQSLAEGDAEICYAAASLAFSSADWADGRRRKSVARALLAKWLGLSSVRALDSRTSPRAGRGKRG